MEATTVWAIFLSVLVAIVCVIFFRCLSSLMFPKKKLHVEYEDALTGNLLMKIMVAVMPKTMFIKRMAPKSRPLDVFEVLQEDPYKIKEVEDGKVWIVSYKYGHGNPSEGKRNGMGDDQATYEKALAVAKHQGSDKVAQLDKDWVLWKEYFKIDPEKGNKGEYCRAATRLLNMIVVKLTSGDVLLYCPVTVHDGTSLDTFLRNLGTVTYIVIGSSYHTNHLSATTKRYPAAKVIGTTPAGIKLNVVHALIRKQLDFDLLDHSQFMDVWDILENEGVKLYFSKHDAMTNSIFLLAYNTGCEVDLLYGHHDACTCDYRYALCDSIKEKEEKDYAFRIFRLLKMSKPNSPNGKLATYRFAGMDPTSPMSSMASYPNPAPDGSSCIELATFLRQILKLDYKQVASVHSYLQTSDNFKKSIDVDWNWLDGRSLLS